jgi:hypothetical protein
MQMWKSLVQALYDEQWSLTEDENLFACLVTNEDSPMVAPQIYFLLKEKGRLSEIPAFSQAILKEKFSESLIQNFFIKTQTEHIFRSFDQKKIDAIPLKGVGFSQKVFGHMAARPTSDIDLLIHPEDFDKAVECVKALGFVVAEVAIPEHFHCSFSKVLPGSAVPLKVEIHWNIVREDTATFDIQEFWEGAVPRQSYQHIKELSNYHTFYMIVLHGWRHNLQSLKYFLDIIQMICMMRHELDYTRLIEDARRHKTAKRVIRTLSIVYQEFPFLEDWVPFPYKRTKRIWSHDSGKNNVLRKYAAYIDYQFFSFDTLGHSVKEFFHWLKYEVPKPNYRKVRNT